MTGTLLLVVPAEFNGENQGLYVQHVLSMAWLLESGPDWSVQAIGILDPDLAARSSEADVVVIHMLSHARAEDVIRRRRALGLPTVFEISDNFLELGDWLPPRHLLRNPLARQRILFHAFLCDALQVYSAPLAKLFATVNPAIAVFDPYVPLADASPPRADGAFVFGWGGTTSHARDIARIAPAIVDFCARHPDAVFAFVGDKALFDGAFGAIRPEQVRYRPFGPYFDYLDFVRTWHVGLAPLGRHGFDNGRTDTKFATYAACRVAPLLEAHPIHQPHADVAALFDGPGQLTEQLEWLHADIRRATDLAERAYRWACRERNVPRLRAQRTALYESLAADPNRSEDGLPGETSQHDGEHSPGDPRIDRLRAMLREQPYDYIALMNLIPHLERDAANSAELDILYRRLCLIAPTAVPLHRRPAALRDFLPA